jgi:hypothetical protein
LPPNNWILATFPTAVSTIVVFPNIDHFGAAYDGYQYTIQGSNDLVTWTPLFDATGVSAMGEPFTLTGHTGTPPSTVNNVSVCNATTYPVVCPSGGAGPLGNVGYIAYFAFGTAYKYYVFGASTVAAGNNPSPNTDQELSAVGTPVMRGPTSGAMLTIHGFVGLNAVNCNPNAGGPVVDCNIYDEQVHAPPVQFVTSGPWPQCNSNDVPYRTDAYVLEGGSATGCDPVLSNNTFAPGTGTATISGCSVMTFPCPAGDVTYSFAITTKYVPGCNTSRTICSPSGMIPTGLLTVTNNSTADLLGTLTLSGDSRSIGGANCPATGTVMDSTSGLPMGQSVTLALSPGSNNCGGFNRDQILPISMGKTIVFSFGKDKYALTPTTPVNPEDTIAFRPEAEPQDVVIVDPLSPFGITNGVSQTCVSVADFSATTLPVCPALQFVCYKNGTNTKCGDNEKFYQKSVFYAHLNPFDPLEAGGIGGVHDLGATDRRCPQRRFDADDTVSFTGDTPGDYPHTSGGPLNCFYNTFDRNAPKIAAGVTASAFDCCGASVSTTALNVEQLGNTVPITIRVTAGDGGTPVNNLQECNQQPSGVPLTCDVPAPFIFLATSPIACQAAAADTSGVNIAAADNTIITNPGRFNFLGDGTYLAQLKIGKDPSLLNTCFQLNVQLWTDATVMAAATFEIGHQ